MQISWGALLGWVPHSSRKAGSEGMGGVPSG